MPRRPASVTQTEIDRAIKAAKKAGAPSVTIEAGGVKLTFNLVEIRETPKATVAKPRRALI